VKFEKNLPFSGHMQWFCVAFVALPFWSDRYRDGLIQENLQSSLHPTRDMTSTVVCSW